MARFAPAKDLDAGSCGSDTQFRFMEDLKAMTVANVWLSLVSPVNSIQDSPPTAITGILLLKAFG